MVEWNPISGMPNEDDLVGMIVCRKKKHFKSTMTMPTEWVLVFDITKYFIGHEVKIYPCDNFVVGKKGRRWWKEEGVNNTTS